MAIACFAVLLECPRKYLLHAGCVGAVGGGVYLFSMDLGLNVVLASFLSALVIALFSHTFARVFRAPVTIFLIPGILPTVPGAGMYRIVYYVMAGDTKQSIYYLIQTLEYRRDDRAGDLFGRNVVFRYGSGFLKSENSNSESRKSPKNSSEKKIIGRNDMTTEQVKEQLQTLAEDDYKAFNENLLPGVKHILGVRLPLLRKIAKEIAKTDCRVYLNEAAETIGAESFYEELMIQGLVIGYAKLRREERVRYLDEFVPKIQSWGICDSCTMGFKFMQKEPEFWFSYIRKYKDSSSEFELRFLLVALLAHYVECSTYP